jgi:K+-transporting ATPase ATPase B chain
MANQTSLFTGPLMAAAARDSFVKLDPRTLIRNPVMFVTGIVAALSTMLLVKGILTGGAAIAFQSQLAFWLWLTVLFGNFAEAMAEGRGKAQAASLRSTKADLIGKLLVGVGDVFENTPAHQLEVGDVVLVETGDLIPADGEGVASVNEAAITGESAPVIREAGGDRSAVTAGTRVIADSIRVRVTAAQGQGFLDRMIALVEGASRQKTPNEIALTILLAGLTLIFLIAVGTLPAFAAYAGGAIAVPVLVALFVTLIPTTISALLSAIGIAGMDRLVRFNVLAKSGRAVEAAGDIDTLLLDKTGTITIGDRQATAFLPIPGVSDRDLIAAARLASLSDETPEGRSIVVLAGDGEAMPAGAEPIKFTSQTRVSGLQIGDRSLVKGAVDAVLRRLGGSVDPIAAAALTRIANDIARSGGTPLAVADGARLLGVIHLKDIVCAAWASAL